MQTLRPRAGAFFVEERQMDWLEEVRARAKRRNKVLFMPGDALFDALSPLTERADRRALVLWALSLADDAVSRLRALLPEETRPMDAVRLARQWSRGEVKMPVAKAAILACHAVAKENVSPEAAALCHAVGQACAVVHARGHAMGFAVYELTAIAAARAWRNAAPRRSARLRIRLPPAAGGRGGRSPSRPLGEVSSRVTAGASRYLGRDTPLRS